MADRAAPGDAKMAHDPSAVIGVVGEIERRYSAYEASSEDQELPPLNLEPLKRDETTGRSEE